MSSLDKLPHLKENQCQGKVEEENHKSNNQGSQQLGFEIPCHCFLLNKDMVVGKASELQQSTQPTKQEFENTPKDSLQFNYGTEFELTPKFNLPLNFTNFGQKQMNITLPLIPSNSKKHISSVSGDLVSSGKNDGDPLSMHELQMVYPQMRSKSLNFNLSPSGTPQTSGINLTKENIGADNKPVSLCLADIVIEKKPSKPRVSKKLSKWMFENDLLEESRPDSMYISSRVIRTDGNNEEVCIDPTLQNNAPIAPLDERVVKRDEMIVQKCPKPKSLGSSSQFESGVGDEEHDGEEMEVPCSDEEEMEVPCSDEEEMEVPYSEDE